MYGKSGQKEYGKYEHMTVEKYARIPDSVLRDLRLSASARCVYGVLARHAFQGGTASIGQRRLAAFLGVHLETVNRAIRQLEALKHNRRYRQGQMPADLPSGVARLRPKATSRRRGSDQQPQQDAAISQYKESLIGPMGRGGS
ncbi:MAG: helix-turn-helix domain-containing protein [Acidobacteriia bacterium]|nr:helix-turn-helix domain-containing protein [Terriglobia bacterium]